MSSYKYQNELKKALSELRLVQIELKKFKETEEKLKSSIKQWMELNELMKHEEFDTEDNKWSIIKTKESERLSITDWNLFEQIVKKQSDRDVLVKKTKVAGFYKIETRKK